MAFRKRKRKFLNVSHGLCWLWIFLALPPPHCTSLNISHCSSFISCLDSKMFLGLPHSGLSSLLSSFENNPVA